jgi:hypothetical protein
MAAKKSTPFAVDPPRLSGAPRGRNRVSRKRPVTLTIQDAFSDLCSMPGDLDRDYDLERELRAVAFLLTRASDMGNRDVKGFEAFGLAKILEHQADEIGYLAGRNERP